MSRRVTVVGSTRRLDATLPDSVPVAELLSDVVDMLGESENGVALEWRLTRVGGQALDPELSLAEQDVVEGTMLFLRDRSNAPPAPLLDDFAGRVAVAVDAQRGRWTSAMTPAVLAWLGGACLAAAGFAVLAAGDARAQTWVGVAGSAVSATGAFMQRRAARRPVQAVVVAFAGLPAWAAVGAGVAGLAGAGPTGILAAGVAGAAIGSLVAIAVVGEVAFAPAEGFLAAAGVPAVMIGATAAFGGSLVQAAALVVVAELVVLALLAPLNVRLAEVMGAEPSSLGRRLASSRRLQAASLIGTAIAVTVASAVLAVSDGWYAKSLVGVIAVAVAARARHYRFALEVVPLLAAGLASLIMLEVVFAAWLPALLIADAVVLLAGATMVRRWTLSPQLRRWLGPLETLAITASVPLALGVLGFYNSVAHLARGL